MTTADTDRMVVDHIIPESWRGTWKQSALHIVEMVIGVSLLAMLLMLTSY